MPIGFWLRRVDALFESSMDAMFAAEDLTRRMWQALSTIKRNEPASVVEVAQAMAMFLDADTPVSPWLEDLAGRGWIVELDGRWRLTGEGRTAVAGLERQVAAHRDVMFRGVDDLEYRTTVETLARIADNLDPEGNGAASFT